MRSSAWDTSPKSPCCRHLRMRVAIANSPRSSAMTAPNAARSQGGIGLNIRSPTTSSTSVSHQVDAVYIALPNSMHAEYTIRAARAGVHVLCEKPMAVTVEECRQMIAACRKGRVKLMIAYRLHFETLNLAAMDLARRGRLGELKFFTSSFSMTVRRGDIRTKRAYGGGTLYDIGVYCINAARNLFRAEPTQVSAVSDQQRRWRHLAEIDETTAATLRFGDDQMATFVTSFNAADVAAYRIVGTKGRPTCRPRLRVCRRSEIYAHRRRQNDEEGGRQTRSVCAGASVLFRLHSERPASPNPRARRACRMCESFKRSIDRRRPVDPSPSDRFRSGPGRHHANGLRVPVSESRRLIKVQSASRD